MGFFSCDLEGLAAAAGQLQKKGRFPSGRSAFLFAAYTYNNYLKKVKRVSMHLRHPIMNNMKRG
jgi:hypothetical protein